MRKVLQKNKLTYEEFQTVIIEIEGILKPCSFHGDSSDTFITPSHLTCGRDLLTEILAHDIKNDYSNNLQHLQNFFQRF